MEEVFLSSLKLLQDLSRDLDRLAQLEQQKSGTVRDNDLLALDEVLKQEQALSLSLRGLEIKRGRLSAQLGLDNVPLDQLAQRCPPHLQEQAKGTVSTLRSSYSVYRSYADLARSALELNLHQIDKFLLDAGVDPKLAAEGYEAPPMEPPKKMKTDFRA